MVSIVLTLLAVASIELALQSLLVASIVLTLLKVASRTLAPSLLLLGLVVKLAICLVDLAVLFYL